MKTSLRVHFITHHDGRKTGRLLRRWQYFFEEPPPSAYGATEAEILAAIEGRLVRELGERPELVERYLFGETFQVREVKVTVHPASSVNKRPVVGKEPMTLRTVYAYAPIAEPAPGRWDEAEAQPTAIEAYRVVLPRLGIWLVLEDLASAPEVLRTLLGAVLMGQGASSLYDLRAEGEEQVRAWAPAFLADGPLSGAEEERDDAPPEELSRIADDWVALHARGKLAPVVGEAPEIEVLRRAAAKTPPPSILLVGPAGAGKTALARRLVRVLASDARARRSRRRPHLWATSAGRIVAGMVYLGMWQERVLRLVSELSGRGEWLHVDRLAELARPQPDGTSIAEMLEPAIALGDVSLLAEATESELEHLKRRAGSLVAKFEVVRVRARTVDETIALVGPWAARKPTIELHPSAAERLVRHVDGIVRDQVLPGAALRFVDWLAESAGAAEGPRTAKRTYYAADVSQAFSSYSGIPLEMISDEHAQSAEDIAAKLRARVIGQDEACAACGRLLARFKAGVTDPERPTGSLLFVGPTGVGKTELAKTLARTLFGSEARLVRLDMSEYGAPGSASRMLATGDGVSSLAQAIRERPLSVVLLDEIEKAHPEIFDLLLGVLGEGRLTDEEGRLVDCRGAIIVMTSNLGVIDRPPVGFGSRAGDTFIRAVRRHFRPEFWNRVDLVLPFRALDRQDVLAILDLVLAEVTTRRGLARRGITLEVDADARAALADLGFHPMRGARPLRRVVEERVVAPIAARLAADPKLRSRAVAIRGASLTVDERA